MHTLFWTFCATCTWPSTAGDSVDVRFFEGPSRREPSQKETTVHKRGTYQLQPSGIIFGATVKWEYAVES